MSPTPGRADVSGRPNLVDSPATLPTSRLEPLCEFRNVVYEYNSKLRALDGVSLELGRGEIIAIVGPSGCGKSTLLSLLAGLEAPTSGSIEWTDTQEAQHRSRLSMVFQRDTVFPWRTVEKNVQFGLECQGIPAAEREEWTDKLLRMAGLRDFRRAYPRQLSGGMRRRVALLTALAVRPATLLLDEPFSALDEPTRVEIVADVLKLSYDLGVSVVLVTHDLAEAISLADRIIVMSARPGRIRKVFDVPFGHDRNVFTLRETAEYSELYPKVWHELWSAIRGEEPGKEVN